MKKVLFFLESLSGGGAEKVLSDIVCNIDKKKYDITVCTVTDGDVYQDKVSQTVNYVSLLKKSDYDAGGIKKILFWIKLKFIYNFPTRWIYKYYIKDIYDVEVAFIEGFATKFIGASSNTSSRKLAWVHIDMLKNNYADNFYRSIEEHKETYNRYDTVVCVAQSVKEAFERKFFCSDKICVQYNPVDSKEINRKSLEKVDIKRKEAILLGTVGRLENQKGYLRLLKSLKILHDEGYGFEVWIIGKGSQYNELNDFILANQMSDYVILLGFQKNPYKYINLCDAFICSSYAEGFSTAATESLILGKPIFTVDCSGMSELFGNMSCGVIVANDDQSLLQLLRDIVSYRIKIDDYKTAVKIRAADFEIDKRIKEIERLLE